MKNGAESQEITVESDMVMWPAYCACCEDPNPTKRTVLCAPEDRDVSQNVPICEKCDRHVSRVLSSTLLSVLGLLLAVPPLYAVSPYFKRNLWTLLPGRYNDKKEVWLFSGRVAPGELFTFHGTDKKGTLGPKIQIYVNRKLNTWIHTSCSEPIGPGLVQGRFEVVEGYSREGGLLCPLP